MKKVSYDHILPPPPTWNWKVFGVLFVLIEALVVYTHFASNPRPSLTPLMTVSLFLLAPALAPFLYYGLFYLVQSYRYLAKVRKELRPAPTLDVFISHSSRNEQLARIVIEVLEAALPGIKIRCSSVDGYRLDAGGKFEGLIRSEVLLSRMLLALITPESIKSDYVLFELGARWGVGLWTIPLLANGATALMLPGPVSQLNALNCTSAPQMHQMIEKIASVANLHPNDPTKYEPYVLRLQAAAKGEV